MTQKKRKRLSKREDARDKSWVPGQKGQGGEGLSDGYGGSAGVGTGASGPDSTAKADSPSLPSRERIAKVLR
jgi:hypothetical protein